MRNTFARLLAITIVPLTVAAGMHTAWSQSPANIPPPRQQTTVGTQMQDMTNAVGITMDSRSLIIDGAGHLMRDSLDAKGLQTLNNTSKAFGYTGIAASAAAGLYRAGEQYNAGDCEGAGKTAARTGVAAGSDLAVMWTCGAIGGVPGLVVGAGYAAARQMEWGNKAMNAVGDELYYSAKGIFGEGPKPVPFDLDSPISKAPSGFRLNENPFGGRTGSGYDISSLRNAFQAAQNRDAAAIQQRVQQEADMRMQAQAAAAAAADAAATSQALSMLQAQSVNVANSIAASRATSTATSKAKSIDPSAGACASPKSHPTKDGCHSGHDEAAHPGGCHC